MVIERYERGEEWDFVCLFGVCCCGFFFFSEPVDTVYGKEEKKDKASEQK